MANYSNLVDLGMSKESCVILLHEFRAHDRALIGMQCVRLNAKTENVRGSAAIVTATLEEIRIWYAWLTRQIWLVPFSDCVGFDIGLWKESTSDNLAKISGIWQSDIYIYSTVKTTLVIWEKRHG